MNSNSILVVDDDESVRESIRDLLALENLECTLAATAEEGLALASLGKPKLVVSDIQLPDMSGFQLCQCLKKDPQTHDVPVVLISGRFTEPQHRVQGFDLGADEFFAKPFDPAYFMVRLRSILRGTLPVPSPA